MISRNKNNRKLLPVLIIPVLLLINANKSITRAGNLINITVNIVNSNDNTQKQTSFPIEVDNTESMYDLQKKIEEFYSPGERLIFIHKNQTLCPAFTFKFYGIDDGHQILILREKKQIKSKSTSSKIKKSLKDHICETYYLLLV